MDIDQPHVDEYRPGIDLVVEDIDKMFMDSEIEPIIANDIDISTEAGRDELRSRLFTTYDGDYLSTIPACAPHCRERVGGRFEGETCPTCKTKVTTIYEKDVYSSVWIRPPQGVKTFINPVCYALIRKPLVVRGFSILDWLINTEYKPGPNAEEPSELKRLRENNVERGLNFFHDNFDLIINLVAINGRYDASGNPKPLKRFGELLTFVEQNRSKIFCQYLPMPSDILFVLEKNDTGRYVDRSLLSIVDALRNIISLTNKPGLTSIRRQNRTAKALSKISDFYQVFVAKVLCSKKGLCRKHILGSRSHFTARAVITSLTNPHHYQDTHLPWGLSVLLFAAQLTNKLLQRGYTNLDLTAKINMAVNNYDVEIDDIFKELISNHPEQGWPVIIHRNPSLAKASAQLFYANRIKTDLEDVSISMSAKCLIGPNADFDGDALNVLLINDLYSLEYFKRLSPHASSLDNVAARRISKNLEMPVPVVSTISEWLSRTP